MKPLHDSYLGILLIKIIPGSPRIEFIEARSLYIVAYLG
jgi:hypothetical protein